MPKPGGIFHQTERFLDSDEKDQQLQESLQSRMFTALPVTINRAVAEQNTVEAQPTIQLAELRDDGSIRWNTIPASPDLPVLHLGGGGMAITIPVQKGDEGLAIYSSRNIDNWWAKGGIQPQYDARMHALSDGFVIPGFRSKPNWLKAVSTATFQLRTTDGRTYHDFDPREGGTFRTVSPQNPMYHQGAGIEVDVGNANIKGSTRISLTSGNPIPVSPQIVLARGPASAMEAATKQYVDSRTGGGSGGGGGGGGIALVGDVTGAGSGTIETTVVALRHIPLSPFLPLDGQVLAYDAASGTYRPTDVTALMRR